MLLIINVMTVYLIGSLLHAKDISLCAVSHHVQHLMKMSDQNQIGHHGKSLLSANKLYPDQPVLHLFSHDAILTFVGTLQWD